MSCRGPEPRPEGSKSKNNSKKISLSVCWEEIKANGSSIAGRHEGKEKQGEGSQIYLVW